MKLGMVLVLFLYGCGTDLDKDKDGFTVLTGDCDEGNANIHPAAVEICDQLDNDCNGEIDEIGASGGMLFYADIDGDGHGSSAATLEACSLPEGYSTSKRDCDEGNSNNHPDADEICDGEDNDCDTLIDEYTAVDAIEWHPDLDGDGYGDNSITVMGCEAPPDYIADASDCDDIDPNINPGVRELCESEGDENCNGDNNDENADGCTYYYADLDSDGFFGTGLCLCEPTENYWETSKNDCNDDDPNINPAQQDTEGFGDLDCIDGTVISMNRAEVTFAANSSSTLHVPHQLSGGDYNGDGYADIAIGYGQEDQVHIFYGPDIESGNIVDSDVVLEGENFGGYTMVSYDNNADGVDDLILTGGSHENLTTYIFQAPFVETMTNEDAVASIYGDFSSGYQSLHPLGDVNNDGQNDLLWTAGVASISGIGGNVGKSHVFYGPIEGEIVFDDANFTIRGEYAGDRLGRFAGGVGDLDGDGLGDIALGSKSSTMYSANAGSVRLFYGTSNLVFPDTVISANAFYKKIGYQLADKTDFNGDGYNDLVFSADDSDVYMPNGGRVNVLYGPFIDGQFELMNMDGIAIYGEASNDKARCVRAAGDLDSDGRDDILIGSSNIHFEDTNDGSSVYAYFGENGEGGRYLPENSVKFPTNYDGLGDCQSAHGTWLHHFVSPGDVNGDGLNDLLISSKHSDELDPDNLINVRLFWGETR